MRIGVIVRSLVAIALALPIAMGTVRAQDVNVQANL
jgi:hypothetical protein